MDTVIILILGLQAIVLVVMYVEALTVVIRQQNHIRITRVLRPLFLLDTHYMKDVRRYIYVEICTTNRYYLQKKITVKTVLHFQNMETTTVNFVYFSKLNWQLWYFKYLAQR